MKNSEQYPWAEFLGPDDVIGCDHTYDSFAQLDKFEERRFTAIDPRVGDIRYFVYDPTKHGYPADKKYPLLFALHGANGGFQDRVAIDWAGAAMYASEEYQKKLGGMYIVCPLANEKRDAEGKMYDSWPTVKEEGDVSIYNEKQQAAIYAYNKIDTSRFIRFGSDSIYSETLYTLLHDSLQEFTSADPEKVVLFGTSAGGYMAWRLVINHPEDYALAVIMAGAYMPAECELQKIEEAGTQVLVCHGKHDELVNYGLFIETNLEYYQALPHFTTFLPEFCRDGAHGVISVGGTGGRQQGQHCVNNCIQQNLIYDDGTLYDERFPEGMIGIMNQVLGK